MQCPKCEAQVPPKRKACPRCKARLTPSKRAVATAGAVEPVRRAAAASGQAADLAAENAKLARELAEAHRREAATGEVLKVISRSPTDIQPVFDTIVENVVQLGDGVSGFVYRFDGDLIHLVAHDHSVTPQALEVFRRIYPLPPSRTSVIAQTILERTIIHVRDFESDPGVSSASVEMARAVGHRSLLAVPMLRKGSPIGAIAVGRHELRPFSDRDIELLKTFADQAVIAIENTRLFEEVQARTRELSEALEYQTATSDVLSVISRSPDELQPVLDTIVDTAQRLCAADRAFFNVLREGRYHLVVTRGAPESVVEDVRSKPIEPSRGSPAGRALLEKRAVHIEDARTDPEFTLFDVNDPNRARTMLSVPLLRGDDVIGVISVARLAAAPFTQRQIDLVTTFANQAVIAINNVGLFDEVQARTRELTESLAHQTATTQVLNVISRSPTQVQPVFEAIVASAAELCGAARSNIQLYDAEKLHVVATYKFSPEANALFRQMYPMAPNRSQLSGRAILSGSVVHVPDVLLDPDYSQDMARTGNLRSVLSVPMLRDGEPVGVITVSQPQPTPFSERQIGLLKTFADQAVIAIENTRLFEEVQVRTRELTVALERQTAMSEILGIISASPGKLEPVFDAILKRARELCAAKFGHLLLFDGETWRPVALHNVPGAYAEFWHSAPAVGFPGTLLWRLQETKQPFQLDDSRLGQAYRARIPLAVATVELGGARTLLGVPLLKDGQVIGAIVLYRTEVRPFDDQQIALLSAFAAQAVIAIENARLLADLQERQRELARSVEELKSLGEVSQAVNASLELDKVLPTILEHACAMSYANGGTVYAFDKASGEFHLAAGHNMSEEHIARVRAQPIRLGDVVVGECAGRREAVQVADLDTAKPSPLLDVLLRAGVRAVLSVPLLHQGEVIGALVVRRNHPGAFSPEIIRLLEAFAAQSAVAVHNARLFKEVEEKGRQLAIASQHKSQFVANMSHELRTPLAAILGYAELLKEGIYGALPEKSTPIVGRIQSNGTHLLGLINTVLDLSKIEAGQFSLSMSDYALDSMVENVRVATESLAQAKNLAFKTDVAHQLPFGLGDEQRLTQVLLNLVGNAIKFTDAGEVRVAAGLKAGRFSVAVTDTGPGIPAEEQLKIFEEFHQVDSSNTKKKGGTGLGLAIARQIVEMHGGRIWVESSLGKGSTFRMELPVRAATAKGAQ